MTVSFNVTVGPDLMDVCVLVDKIPTLLVCTCVTRDPLIVLTWLSVVGTLTVTVSFDVTVAVD